METVRKNYTPMHLQLTQVVCTSCGKAIRQLEITNRINQNENIIDILNDLGYTRMCCKNNIMSAPVIVELQKKVENSTNPEEFMRTLTLEATSGISRGPVIKKELTVANVDTTRYISQRGNLESPMQDAYKYHLKNLTGVKHLKDLTGERSDW